MLIVAISPLAEPWIRLPQDWDGCWSGDTALGPSFIWSATALAYTRRRRYTPAFAAVGGAVATCGSVMRILALMHWATDVLLGILMGALVGGGLPLAVFRASTVERQQAELELIPQQASDAEHGAGRGFTVPGGAAQPP